MMYDAAYEKGEVGFSQKLMWIDTWMVCW